MATDFAEKCKSQKVMALKPAFMDYAWGIRGLDSRVARYALETGIIDEVDPDTPYAELWIGTHEKGPSCLKNGALLESELGRPLPFLFKVLSCGKTLSIQAHPDKTLAQKLHESNPAAYGDANHKPEMAIALTPFEAMCGFRRIEEISILLKKHPEFAACVSNEAKLAIFMCGYDNEYEKRVALRLLFNSFMSCPEKESSIQLKKMLKRLQNEQTRHMHPHEEPPWERKCARAILRLTEQFPGDAGAMAPLFLNYLLIAPGEAFFMAPNEPHAYVAGEIIECMACSDNVVRAGLTPKFKDVPNLISMLTYSSGGPNIDVGTPAYDDDRIMRYTPPVPEFEVMVLTCHPGQELVMPQLSVPAVCVVIEGSGMGTVKSTSDDTNGDDNDSIALRPGGSYYVAPSDTQKFVLSVAEQKRGPLKLALAHENLHMKCPTVIQSSGEAKHWKGEFDVNGPSAVVPGSPPVSPHIAFVRQKQIVPLTANTMMPSIN